MTGKSDEQIAEAFVRANYHAFSATTADRLKAPIANTMALIQAVRAERDAELADAHDRLAAVAGILNANGPAMTEAKRFAFIGAVLIEEDFVRAKAASPPPRAEPPKSAETKACPECGGTGEVEHRETGGHSCWTCRGSGRIAVEKSRPCDHCGGDGGNLETGTAFFGSGPDCPTCLGTGRIPTSGAAKGEK